MKIFYLTQDYPPLIGGIAAHVWELSNSISKLNHDVHIITDKINDNNYHDKNTSNYHVHRIDVSGYTTRKFFSYLQRTRSIIFDNISESDDVIVHSHNEYRDNILMYFLPRKFHKIYTCHSSMYLNLHEQGKTLQLKIRSNSADYLIAPSKELLDVASLYGRFINGKKYIPNGVDDQKFYPDNEKREKFRSEHNINTNTLVILCPRRLVEKNGVIYLIRAFNDLIKSQENLRLIIVGDGPLNAKLISEQTPEARERTLWLGSIPNEKMIDIYNAADVVVLPSLKEATSIAGLEAMACEKMLVGTRVGGIPDIIINDYNGFLVKPKNYQDISNTLSSIIENKRRILDWGINSRNKIENEFSWSNISQKTLEVYKSCINYKN